MRTKYLPVKYSNLVSGKYASAGPRPNITGMKKLYWDVAGRESVTVMCGNYLYLLGWERNIDEEARRIYDILAR